MYSVVKLNNLKFPTNEDDKGIYARIGASNINNSLYQPKYLVQIWETFSTFNFYQSCSFLMHPENLQCVDNEPG